MTEKKNILTNWLKPTFYLLTVLAAGLFIYAQVQLFELKIAQSITWTVLAILVFIIGLYLDKLLAAGKKLWSSLSGLKSVIESLAKKASDNSEKTIISESTDITTVDRTLEQNEPLTEATSPVDADQPIVFQPPKWIKKLTEPLTVRIPTLLLLIAGAVLLVAGQPFLFLESFLIALLLLIPGALLLGFGLSVKSKYVELGQLQLGQKAVWVSLLGVAVMIFGDYLLFLFLQEGELKEFIGLTVHLLGIAVIISTFPDVIDDPKKEEDEWIEEYTGEAKNKWAVVLKIGLVIVSIAFFVLAQAQGKQGKISDHFIYLMMAVGTLLLSFPWLISRPKKTAPTMAATYFMNVIRLLAVIVACIMAYHGQVDMTHDALMPAINKFFMAIVLVILALGRPEKEPLELSKESPLKWYWEVIGLILILAIAAYWRFHLLDLMPAGLEGDEAGTARNARVITNMVHGGYRSITAHWQSQPLFWLFPLNLTHHLFGLGNVGLRLLPAFYGLLSIIAIHLIGRLYFGGRIGLALAALVAISRWHLHFSRFGWANTLMILMMTIGFYFLIKSFKDRRKWFLFLAGAAFAYSVQTETAGRLVPIICFAVLAYMFVIQKHFFKRHWKAITILFLGAWLVGGAYFLLMAKKPYLLMQRVKEVSIFSEDPNAAPSAKKGFLDSSRLSFTMMNWHGDYRTRHNGGMSGEPMLDFWTAILFALGFGYSVYYWKRARLAVVLIWFMGGLAGSIFSIEAPQAHRSFGLFPAMFLMIGYFLAKVQQLMRRVLGKPGVWIAALVFGLMLIPAGKINYKKYFETYPRFDPGYTEMARYVGSLGDDWLSLVSTYGWMGHPPFELYARTANAQFLYNTFDMMPLTFPNDKNVSFVAVEERAEVIPSLQYYYPQGELKELSHPQFGTLVTAWNVKQQDLQSVHGLNASYYTNPDWQGKAIQQVDQDISELLNKSQWPIKTAGSAIWEGTLWIPHYREYTFYLRGTDYIEVQLGEYATLRSDQNHEAQKKLALPGGLLPIRIKARHSSSQSKYTWSWQSNDSIDYFMYKCRHQEAFAKERVPDEYLFSYKKPTGLMATYYMTPDWSGDIRLQFIEPVVFTDWFSVPFGMPPPLSTIWKGQLIVPQDGAYKFEVTSTGYTEIHLDHKPILVQSYGAPENWKVPQGPFNNPVNLKAGVYPIEVRWSLQSHNSIFKLWWTPPGGKQQTIPTQYLIPGGSRE